MVRDAYRDSKGSSSGATLEKEKKRGKALEHNCGLGHGCVEKSGGQRGGVGDKGEVVSEGWPNHARQELAVDPLVV